MNAARTELVRAPSAEAIERKADMTLHHCWFRVLLHLAAIVRRPRNMVWHLRLIANELRHSNGKQ